MPRLSLLARRLTRLTAVSLTALLVGLSVPISQTLWVKVLRITGAINMRAPEARSFEGCPFGFWEQPQHFAFWPDPYEPETSFESVFGRDLPEDPTLLDALELEGGGLEALMRQVAAALLNAASPEVDYPFPVDVVVTKFQASFDLENYDPATEGFESANEAGCPMDTAGDLTETPTASPSPTITPTATPGLTATIEATPTEAEATMPSPTASSESPTATATPPEATPTSVPSTDQGTPGSGP